MFEFIANTSTASTPLLLIFILLLLLAIGVWVGLSLLATGIIAMAFFTTQPIGDAMATSIWSALTGWTLTSLPLFIWMGEILFRSKIAESLFKSLTPWAAPFPGRLLQSNVLSCALFAAISGSSAATCATIGKISLPELRKRNYPEYMVVSSLIGSGTLGLLIPPSIIMIVYGAATDVSINKLFIGGIFPGLLLALLFTGYVGIWSIINHDKIPAADSRYSIRYKIKNSGGLIPVLGLIVSVLGSIYTGFATATQAAAIGVLGTFIVSFFYGSLSIQIFIESAMGAMRTTTMIMLILAGSAFLSLAMGFTGIPGHLVEWVIAIDLSPAGLLIALTLMFLVMGCFLDGISIIVLTTAVLLPVIQSAEIDLLWFGIYMVLVVEMAQITPPVGLNLFVLQGITQHDIIYLSKAAVPCFLLMLVAVVLIYFFPSIATFLPQYL